MLKITASIVAYKTKPFVLSRAIQSVLNSASLVRLFVVDNSPTDQLRSVVSARGAEYVWVRNNVGFGAGHNIAISRCQSTSKYHLVINPDVYFGSGVVESLISFMEENPRAGLVMPRVMYPDGCEQHLCKLLPTPTDLIMRRLLSGQFERLLRRRTERYELRNADPAQILQAPVLSGCFMVIRNEVFATVGKFDERFFMYLEDVDLCRRIHTAFDVIYYPHVSVFHEYAKGSYKTWRLTKYHVASACRYFGKWGWFRDSKRKSINEKALAQIRTYEQQRHLASETAISS